MPSGGRRAGAGRKLDTQVVVKVQMVLTLYPDTRDKLKANTKACNTHSVSADWMSLRTTSR